MKIACKTMTVSAASASILMILTAICEPAQCHETGKVFEPPGGEVRLAANTSQKQKAGEGIAPLKEEFERVCGQTESASSLTPEQLRALVKDSDQLLEQLSNVTDRWAKVYVFRLKKCRDFFKFMLESQETGQRTGQTTVITNAFTRS